MEPLTDVNALAAMEADTLPGHPSEEAPESEEQLDLAEELVGRDKEAERLRQDMARLEQRLHDTQQWANNNNMARIAAEAAAAAVTSSINRQEQGRRQEEQQRAQVPRLTATEKEAILADPDLLESVMERKIDYGVKWAVQEVLGRVAPTLQQASQQANGLSEISAGQSELLARVAINEARSMAERSGVAVEDFDRLLPDSFNYLTSAAGGDDVKLRSLGTNPEAILMAVNLARSRNGVPVEKPVAPPSIGSGRRPTRPAKPALQVPPKLAEISAKLGVAVTPDMVKEYNSRFAAAGGGR